MTLQDLILKLSAFWASRGCLIQQPLDLEVGAGTSHPGNVVSRARARARGTSPTSSRRGGPTMAGSVRIRNRLFKHLQMQVILKPAPDEVQQTLSRQPRGLRHQSAPARHPVRRGQLGIADARRLGHRLAGDARRPGDHAVHLFPAGGRRRSRAGVGGDHLRPRANRDVPAEGRQRLRPRMGRRA